MSDPQKLSQTFRLTQRQIDWVQREASKLQIKPADFVRRVLDDVMKKEEIAA